MGLACFVLTHLGLCPLGHNLGESGMRRALSKGVPEEVLENCGEDFSLVMGRTLPKVPLLHVFFVPLE